MEIWKEELPHYFCAKLKPQSIRQAEIDGGGVETTHIFKDFDLMARTQQSAREQETGHPYPLRGPGNCTRILILCKDDVSKGLTELHN